jgi:peptidoglycan/xylan/chitin deacetylase (PgdA/CDA1 family)
MGHRLIVSILFLTVSGILLYPQAAKDYQNDVFLEKLYKDTAYINLKNKITSEFSHKKPGKWGEFFKGVLIDEMTSSKAVALTFDACGGAGGSGFDKDLIDYLVREKVPVTLFISGKWIDENFDTFIALSRDTLFEIENHGLNHRPFSLDGESAYGIHGTLNSGEAFDEIEANAWKIRALTNRYPNFYRSATTFVNEICVNLADKLGIKIVCFHILAGDALPKTSSAVIEDNVVRNIKSGAIVLMHMNHPERNTSKAVKKIVPELRSKGYSFWRLSDFEKIIPKNY